MKTLLWWLLGTKREFILMNAAREICSTNEGQDFARKFLYIDGDDRKGPNVKNQKWEFYGPLKTFFENC